MSTTTVSLETDADGFVSQECPSCSKLFKVKFGESSSRPIGYCPYCGHAGHNCWWTQAQADFIGATAGQELVGPMLDRFARDLNRGNRAGGLLSIKASIEHAPCPVRPSEPNEPMPIKHFECCGERIKHADGCAKLHCIICGAITDAASAATESG